MQVTADASHETSSGIITGNITLDSDVLWKHFQDRMIANAEYEKQLTTLARELISRLPAELNNDKFLRSLSLSDMNQFLMSVLRAFSNRKTFSPGNIDAYGFELHNSRPLSRSIRELARAWDGIIKVDYEQKTEHYIDIVYFLDRKYP